MNDTIDPATIAASPELRAAIAAHGPAYARHAREIAAEVSGAAWRQRLSGYRHMRLAIYAAAAIAVNASPVSRAILNKQMRRRARTGQRTPDPTPGRWAKLAAERRARREYAALLSAHVRGPADLRSLAYVASR